MNTILLVDDEEPIRTVFSSVLRQKGYNVLEADSGLLGYEMAKEFSPDVIITDVAMQGGGGEALLYFIRNDAQLAHKQVVLMTGNPDALSPRKGMESGADDFLVKPVSLEALIACIEARLKRAKVSTSHVFKDLARRQEELEEFIVSAKVEALTPTFRAWARAEEETLAIVFTDVVGFTKLCEEIKEGIREVRSRHFARSRELIERYQGFEIKTMGDSVLSAFHSTRGALRYATKLQEDTGHPLVHVRVGIHFGPVHIEEKDVFGGTVNFAGRIVNSIEGAEIWLSDEAKTDLETHGEKYAKLQWQKHDNISLKGFNGTWTLWSVNTEGIK